MAQRSELQNSATVITHSLLWQLHAAACHVDADMARSAIMSCRDRIDPQDATVRIVGQARRHVMRAVEAADRKTREQALWLAYELVEIGWRDSIHNRDNQAFENAAGPDGRPRLTVIQGGKA